MAAMEMMHVIPLTIPRLPARRRVGNLKSPTIFELIALIREVAVEMMAARTAHPTSAVIHGLVVWAIVVINTLLPGGISRPIAFASEPKKTGTTHTIIVPIPANNEALETMRGEAPAKQRCPISCSITMKSSGINNHPKSFEETGAMFESCDSCRE